jgi:hypothetical protein
MSFFMARWQMSFSVACEGRGDFAWIEPGINPRLTARGIFCSLQNSGLPREGVFAQVVKPRSPNVGGLGSRRWLLGGETIRPSGIVPEGRGVCGRK